MSFLESASKQVKKANRGRGLIVLREGRSRGGFELEMKTLASRFFLQAVVFIKSFLRHPSVLLKYGNIVAIFCVMSVEAEVAINKLTWPLVESLSLSRH